MIDDTLRHLKTIIEDGDLLGIQETVAQLDIESLPLDYIVMKTYLHACLRKKPDIAEWILKEAKEKLDPIQWIAIRTSIPYGRYLLNK